MNKKGKTNPLWIIVGIIGVIALMVIAYGQFSQSVTGSKTGTTNPLECPDSTGTVTITGVSALDGASDPTVSILCGVNGGQVKTNVTSGTTTFAIGTELECLISASDYIDTTFTDTVGCGGLVAQVPLYYATSDNPALTIKDPDNSDSTVTDAIGGGATNLTAPSAGSSVKFDAYFEGTNTEGTGEMIYVVEFPASSSANITDVTMGDLQKVSIPQVHTLQNAGSKAVAFVVPNIEGAVEPSYRVIATLGTGKTLVGGVYTDWYAGQDFVDDNGFISSGVEDSDGTAKYENTADYDFYIL